MIFDHNKDPIKKFINDTDGCRVQVETEFSKRALSDHFAEENTRKHVIELFLLFLSDLNLR